MNSAVRAIVLPSARHTWPDSRNGIAGAVIVRSSLSVRARSKIAREHRCAGMSDEQLLDQFEVNESKDDTSAGLIGWLLQPNLLLGLSCLIAAVVFLPKTARMLPDLRFCRSSLPGRTFAAGRTR